MLGTLTFMLADSGGQRAGTTSSYRIAEELFAQIQVIQSAITECILKYPGGGGDEDGNGTINSTDNPNSPYPLNPTSANNPGGAAGTNAAINLKCPCPDGTTKCSDGTSGSAANAPLFGGTSGRYLPDPPSAYGTGWTYTNDSDGVRIQIIGTATSQAVLDTVTRLDAKFAAAQAELDLDSCGAGCFTFWIKKN